MADDRIVQDRGHESILASIYEDMDVYDVDGKKVGTVDEVYFGDAEDRGDPAAADVPPDYPEEDLSELIADIFDPSDMPDELARRLLYRGFIEVDGNDLLDTDRFVTPDQISHIEGDNVHLKVRKDDLISERD